MPPILSMLLPLLLLFPAVLAEGQHLKIPGTCSLNGKGFCDIDPKLGATPEQKCPPGYQSGQGNFVDPNGPNGRTKCSPPGTRCKYVWRCGLP